MQIVHKYITRAHGSLVYDLCMFVQRQSLPALFSLIFLVGLRFIVAFFSVSLAVGMLKSSKKGRYVERIISSLCALRENGLVATGSPFGYPLEREICIGNGKRNDGAMPFTLYDLP